MSATRPYITIRNEKTSISRSQLLFIACAFIMVFNLTSCEKESVVEDFDTDFMLTYAGLSLDMNKAYRVDSILFKIGVSGLERDTLRYRFVDRVRDTFRTPDLALHFAVDRTIFSSDRDTTTFFSYSASIVNNTLRIRENNQSIINLVFPPRLNTRWDGLSLFDASDYVINIQNEPIQKFKDWSDFRIVETEGVFEIEGRVYSDVVSVLQVDAENAIERRYAMEKYAPKVGLIYREEMILDTQNISDDPWVEKAERGYILKQYFIAE